ncbi:MAG: lacto-N-biose phosphorylase central domain-containing protein [bacterium]|nr:lacto-N-biose phosphorylase central domain-containing protein [bacterium]
MSIKKWQYMQDSSLTIFSDKYTSKNRFPFNLGATGVYSIPLMKKCKKYYKQARADGLITIPHLSLCFAPEWLEQNPNEKLTFYWLSEKSKASSRNHMISLRTNDKMFYQVKMKPVNYFHSPKKYWRVYDRTDGRILDISEWETENGSNEMQINSVVSHVYQVAYLVYDVEPQKILDPEQCYLNANGSSGNIPQVVSNPKSPANLFYTVTPQGWPVRSKQAEAEDRIFYIANPLSLVVQKHTLSQIKLFLEEWNGCIDVIRVFLSARYTTFLDEKNNPYGGWDENGEKVPGWNWYGYGHFASPANQVSFKEKTGIDFNIDWLTKSKYGQIKYPPAVEYLKWVHFVNKEIINYHVKLSNLCAEYNVRLQTNIGDNWIGIEPYLKNFEDPAFHSIAMYGLGKTVANRQLTGFSNKTKKVLKIWFAAEEGAIHYTGKGALQQLIYNWNHSKRAFFTKFPDELRLETLNEHVNPELKRLVKNIVNEFIEYKGIIGGCKVYCHPINIYILNCWGKLRTWTGWGDDAGRLQNMIQEHLVDMPFNIQWVSFQDISKKGIPEDCDIIFNFGAIGTSWSGDYMWKLPKVKSRIEDFVKHGGGFLGVDAPSFYEGNFILSNLLGISPINEINADASRQELKKAEAHWITHELPEKISLQRGLKVKQDNGNLSSLYSCGDSPEVYVREVDKGRVGYLNGYSNAPEYYQLLKKIFFWLCRKENLSETIHTSEPDVFLYFYKREKILIVYNMSKAKKKVKIQFDLEILNGRAGNRFMMYDIHNGHNIFKDPVSYMKFKNGMKIDIMPWEAKFLKIKLIDK